MSRWWRAYDEAVDDPKLALLTDKQHRAWFNLCCITSQNGGKLPAMAAVAFKLRTTPDKAKLIVAELAALGLIDIDEETGAAAPHNWSTRQYKSDVTDPTNAERQKRYRDRHRVTENAVTDKLPETEQNTERKKDAADAAPPDPERDLFRRGKEVAGKDAGGLIAKLLKAKKNNVSLARAAIEQASQKDNPREYLGAVIAGGHPSADGKRLTNDEVYYGVGRTPGII